MQVDRVSEAVQGEMTANGEAVRAPTDEWTAASLAHASILLTLILAPAGGVGALVGPAIPLAMYFGYRRESRFVALHALQSFVFQVVGAVVVAALGVLVGLAWTISSWLSGILVGLLLIPLALFLTLQLVFVLVAWLGYGLYAAYQVYQGRDMRYMVIGEWLEKEVKA
jgi:uncharacterized Tic20 family protein